jgi:hypothetical protein
MRHLILYVNKNTEGKKDGAEFEREAVEYSRYHNMHGHEVMMVPVPCDVPAPRRPGAVESNLRQIAERHKERRFDVFAYFGHGTERWIQTGHTVGKLGGLASLFEDILTPTATLWFAACKTAAHNPTPVEGDARGFLEKLVHRCDTLALTAWGHTTAGHTTRNPNLAHVNLQNYSAASPEQRKILQKHLWIPNSTLRLQIPLCSSIEDLIERIPA